MDLATCRNVQRLWMGLHCLQVVARSGESIDMEACFSQLTLDVIGKAVFNYNFDSLTTSSPVIQVPQQLPCNHAPKLRTQFSNAHAARGLCPRYLSACMQWVIGVKLQNSMQDVRSP